MDIPDFEELDQLESTEVPPALQPLVESTSPAEPSLPAAEAPLAKVPEPPSHLLLRFEEKLAAVPCCLQLLADLHTGPGVLSIPLSSTSDYLSDLQFDADGEVIGIQIERKAIIRPKDPFYWQENLSSREPPVDLRFSPPQGLTESIESVLSTFQVTFQPSSIEATKEVIGATGPVPQAFKDRYLSCFAQTDLDAAQLPSNQEVSISRSENKFLNAIEDKVDVSDFSRLLPDPAIIYPFELDVFQKRAVLRVEQGENVFVAAHTSAGKTLVAEYAIALAKHHMSRVIYTSPIKALSNQKYRDFKELFGEVGIMTGDVVVDPESFCLVMTTEVLRSMLYRGSSKIKDLEWVILDEVHYINDDERGVVWEEVLIMLPPHVKLVMLSATVPNYLEFSDWVGRARSQKVYVQMTLHRPVPLVHQVYCNGELWDLIETDGTKQFERYEANIARMVKAAAPKATKEPPKYRKKGEKRSRGGKGPSEDQRYKDLVRTLERENLLPCILFSFSRDKCDTRARKLGALDLLTKPELSKVKIFVTKSLKKLSPSDQSLPQVRELVALLERGVGIHHSGLLPILKEMVEILFAEGLVKVMTATETVAIGLNMPTKTVVFCEMRKFDGNEHRNLRPGEYTQMSGRAGRRGKDDCGHVIIFLKDPQSALSRGELELITVHQALDLTSKFRLGYNTIANVLITETLHLEDMARKSFTQNDSINASVQHQLAHKKLLKEREELLAAMGASEDEALLPALEKVDILRKMNENLTQSLLKKGDNGTVLRVMNQGCFNVFAVIRGYNKADGKIDVQLVDFARQMALDNKLPTASYQNATISLANVLSMHGVVMKNTQLLRESCKPQDVKMLQDQIQAALKKQLTSTACFKPQGSVTAQFLAQRDEILTDIQTSPLFNHPNRHELWSNYSKLNEISVHIKAVEAELGHSDLALSDQLEAKLRVMERFGLIDAQHIVQLKGRAIAETDNPFNVVISELMFGGAFSQLEAVDIPPLCSLFVNDSKGELEEEKKEKLSPSLRTALEKTVEVYGDWVDAERQSGVVEDGNEQAMKQALVFPVYQWAKGVSFLDITKLTPVREGNIVRTILRVHELIQRLRNVAVLMGNKDLKAKLEVSLSLINRDIAFATSLYISG